MGKFLKSFVYAFRGVMSGFLGQRNIKIMSDMGLLVVLLGYYFEISRTEWALVVVTSSLVLAVELLNTAGEKLVDILSPDFDPRYGEVKDILAGASLVASIAAACVGFLIFAKPVYHLIVSGLN
jgi:diacylglycerol kinase